MAVGEDPDSGIAHRWDNFKDSPSIVEDRFKDAQAFASGAYQTAMGTIQSLQTILRDLNFIGRLISIDTTLISASVPSEADNKPKIDLNNLQINMPPDPPKPTVIAVQIDPFPDFPQLVVGNLVPPVEDYQSALKDDLKAIIRAGIQNAGGIPAEIEDAMFLRDYQRALLVHQDRHDEISRNWGASGFPMPNGALYSALDKETMDFGNKRMDVSRDIMIKSFELALQNFHFMIQQGIALESQLMTYAHSVAVLALEGAKAVIQLTIDTYRASAEGVKEKILAILEKVRAQIEYNKGLIDIYTAQIQGYSANIQGQAAKVNGNARGYEAQTSVFKTLTDFDISKAGLDLKVLETEIQRNLGNANILIQDKQVDLKTQQVVKELLVEGMKAIGGIASQLSAGAMAGVSAHASMSSAASANYSAGSTLSGAAVPAPKPTT